jgi:uncharacterized protein with NRDE domain
MCLIAIAWRVHPRYRLVLAANRDEYHARPTLPLAVWDEQPQIVGGRDVLKGGSWLAMRGKRLAAVTNVRRVPMREGLSRGALVAGILAAQHNSRASLESLATRAADYSPFNLLMHDGDTLAFATNAPEPDFHMRTLAPGLHGISNGALDAPWPKTEMLMSRLDAWLRSPASIAYTSDVVPPDLVSTDLAQLDLAQVDLAPLFDALADTTCAADEHLPDTGIGLERERFLSPAFITHAIYGTRASTIVLIADDHAQIVERRFGPDAEPLGDTTMRIAFSAAS